MIAFLSEHWEWATAVVVTIVVGLFVWRKLRIKVTRSERVGIRNKTRGSASVDVKKSKDVSIDL